MSKQVFEAIKSDAKASAQNPSKDIQKLDRNFYVVSTGGYHLDNANFNPLLADLAKLGVKVVPVNPIWVMTCAYQNIKCNPEDFPLLFQPQTWPIRLLPPPPSDEDTKFLVSVTGFVDISRYGIIHMLKSVGATYTDTLRAKNTHLICKEATGPKYTRAIEWGAHVVSVQWLYHIIQHGYKEGSEEMFTLAVKKECVDEATVMKTENVEFSDSKRSRKNSSHESRASLNPIEQSGKADGAFENRYATSKANRSGCDVKDDAKTADPPTDSRKKISDERNKRLQFALETLQTPAGTSTISDSNVSQRRSLRRRSNQTSILQSNLDEEENTQNDTQYSIRVDDVIGPALGNSQSGDETEVPLSQTIDEGESQMIWYPAMSR